MVRQFFDAVWAWARCTFSGHDWLRYGFTSGARTCARCLRQETRTILGTEIVWRQVQ